MDEYIRQLNKQNAGGTCDHCHSAMGHYNVCPLINRGIAEVKSSTIHGILATVDNVMEERTAPFYRPERFRATMHVPEFVLTEEDEQFLRGINQAFE